MGQARFGDAWRTSRLASVGSREWEGAWPHVVSTRIPHLGDACAPPKQGGAIAHALHHDHAEKLRMAAPLPSETLHRLIQAVSDLHSIDGAEPFSRRAIRTSNSIVQGEINVYTEIDPVAGRVELVADRGHAALAAVEADFLRLQHQHPGIQLQVQEGKFGVHTISKLVSRREWKALALYNDVYAKMGIEDQLVVSAPMPAPMALGVTISRTRRGFKSSEITALEVYEKHFTHAFGMEQRLADRSSIADSVARSRHPREGFVLANCDGIVQIACPTAETLLSAYFPAEQTETRLLPGRIRLQMTRLSSTAEERLKASTVLRIPRGENELRVELRRHARLDRWHINLRELTADDRRRAEAESLSPRLRSVLELLRLGQSEKEVAHALGLAATTVHGYVKQIFRRLKVHSRSELMALWIRE